MGGSGGGRPPRVPPKGGACAAAAPASALSSSSFSFSRLSDRFPFLCAPQAVRSSERTSSVLYSLRSFLPRCRFLRRTRKEPCSGSFLIISAPEVAPTNGSPREAVVRDLARSRTPGGVHRGGGADPLPVRPTARSTGWVVPRSSGCGLATFPVGRCVQRAEEAGGRRVRDRAAAIPRGHGPGHSAAERHCA